MKPVCGFGINDADYKIYPLVNGKKVMCSAYKTWQNMIRRCYSEKELVKRPTYDGVTVCEDWRSFMAFKYWWDRNNVDGWQLDKDILTDKKEYSPYTCIYIPTWLNVFTSSRLSARGKYPIGVNFHPHRNKFQASCRNTITEMQEYLGLFDSEFLAHDAWRKRKIEIAFSLKEKMDAIDTRIYPRIIEIIKMAK